MLALSLVFAVAAHGADVAQEKAFVEAVKQAFVDKNQAKLEELGYTKGCSPADLKQNGMMMQMIVASNSTVTGAQLAPLPEDYLKTRVVMGKKIELTAKPDGLVEISHAGEKMKGTIKVPYALIDGKYRTLFFKSVDLGWKGAPDTFLQGEVIGPMKGQPLDNLVKYNASGVDIVDKNKAQSFTVSGQYFSEVTVKNSDPTAELKLTLKENGRVVYESEPLKGVGSLEYKRPAEGKKK